MASKLSSMKWRLRSQKKTGKNTTVSLAADISLNSTNSVDISAAPSSQNCIAIQNHPPANETAVKGNSGLSAQDLHPPRDNILGLLPLHDPESVHHISQSEHKYPIDIIAVHGLKGDAYRTYTHKNGNFWLRDSLPKEFPGARIYTYGYPAGVFLSLERSGLDSYGRDLLNQINMERKTVEVCSIYNRDI